MATTKIKRRVEVEVDLSFDEIAHLATHLGMSDRIWLLKRLVDSISDLELQELKNPTLDSPILTPYTFNILKKSVTKLHHRIEEAEQNASEEKD